MYRGINIVLVSLLDFQILLYLSFSLIDDEIDMNMIPKQKYSDDIKTIRKSSYFSDGDQFYLQSNVTIPKSGYIETQIGGYSSNSTYLSAMTWILMIIILTIII